MQDFFTYENNMSDDFDRVWLSAASDKDFYGIQKLQSDPRGFYDNDTCEGSDPYLESPARNICTCEIGHACLDQGFDNSFWSRTVSTAVSQNVEYQLPIMASQHCQG